MRKECFIVSSVVWVNGLGKKPCFYQKAKVYLKCLKTRVYRMKSSRNSLSYWFHGNHGNVAKCYVNKWWHRVWWSFNMRTGEGDERMFSPSSLKINLLIAQILAKVGLYQFTAGQLQRHGSIFSSVSNIHFGNSIMRK